MKKSEYGSPVDFTNSKFLFDSKVEENIANVIKKVSVDSLSQHHDCSTDDMSIYSAAQSSSVVGSYKLCCNDKAYFIRVSEKISNIELFQDLLKWLYNSGAPINNTISVSFVKIFSGSYRFEIREFLYGSHPVGCSLNTLYMLADSINKYQLCLSLYNKKKIVEELFKIRLARLRHISDNIDKYFTTDLEYHHFYESQKPIIMALKGMFDLYDFDFSSCTMVHGEPHPYNMIIVQENCYMLDMEESIRLYVNKEWDYCYLLHRFYDVLSASEYNIFMDYIVRAYNLDRNILSIYLKIIPYILILQILSDLEHNMRAPISELNKFISLAKAFINSNA
jgi:hypothetical protein